MAAHLPECCFSSPARGEHTTAGLGDDTSPVPGAGRQAVRRVCRPVAGPRRPSRRSIRGHGQPHDVDVVDPCSAGPIGSPGIEVVCRDRAGGGSSLIDTHMITESSGTLPYVA
jgi:hypothetical protein